MFENIKKKFNNPEKLMFIFYGATILVILNRFIALFMMMAGRGVELGSDKVYRSLFWHAEEYTLAFLLPLAGFAYLCSSKYGEDTNRKMKAYVGTYALIALICFVAFSIAVAYISSAKIP